jgi:hypothetical protein
MPNHLPAPQGPPPQAPPPPPPPPASGGEAEAKENPEEIDVVQAGLVNLTLTDGAGK